MAKAWGQDPGGIPRDLTDRESKFLTALGDGPPFLDTWLHQDPDGTPWLIVSLDLVNGNSVAKTLRIDFDGTRIAGGDSPACLNWDDGVRASDAQIDTAPPDGIAMQSDDPSELAHAARAWFVRRSA